jgi:hypothetical protein
LRVVYALFAKEFPLLRRLGRFVYHASSMAKDGDC